MAPKFSLQTVLDVRHGKVEALEIELGKLLHAQQQLQAKLAGLFDLQERLQGDLKARLTGDLDLFAAEQLRQNIEMVRQSILATRQAIIEMDAAVEAKRQELVQARQSEETLSILKRKEQDQYFARLAEHENKAVDDMYIAQGFRQRN